MESLRWFRRVLWHGLFVFFSLNIKSIQVESTRAVYERILDLRIATPQIVINYALFLEDHQYFEHAFKVSCITQTFYILFRHMKEEFHFSNGLMFMIFGMPTWKSLLTVMEERNWSELAISSNNVWNTVHRNLLKVCCFYCGYLFCLDIFLLYAKLEENHGLARHAMSIYNRATQAVEKDEMYDVSYLLIIFSHANYRCSIFISKKLVNFMEFLIQDLFMSIPSVFCQRLNQGIIYL